MGTINRLLCLGFAALLLVVNARPLPTGLPARWSIGGRGPLEVLVLFFEARCWTTHYHVACLVRDRGEVVFVDATSGQTRAICYNNFPDSLRSMDPKYAVKAFVPRSVEDGFYWGGLFSCVELTKKILKCNDFSIQTTSQLLRWLWEQKEEGL